MNMAETQSSRIVPGAAPIAIPYEDERDMLHAEGGSFCSDPTCPCHEDVELLSELAQDVKNGLLTPEEATRIASGLY